MINDLGHISKSDFQSEFKFEVKYMEKILNIGLVDNYVRFIQLQGVQNSSCKTLHFFKNQNKHILSSNICGCILLHNTKSV